MQKQTARGNEDVSVFVCRQNIYTTGADQNNATYHLGVSVLIPTPHSHL